MKCQVFLLKEEESSNGITEGRSPSISTDRSPRQTKKILISCMKKFGAGKTLRFPINRSQGRGESFKNNLDWLSLIYKHSYPKRRKSRVLEVNPSIQTAQSEGEFGSYEGEITEGSIFNIDSTDDEDEYPPPQKSKKASTGVASEARVLKPVP